MLPAFLYSSSKSYDYSPKKSKSLSLKNTSFLTSRFRSTFVAAFFCQIIVIFFIFHHDSSSPSSHLERLAADEEEEEQQQFSNQCEFGKVFVYDLPAMFNKDVLKSCHELNPWISRCAAMSNGGLGPNATGLDAVVPENLVPAWYWTDMFNAEILYHSRILNYRCRTKNPEEATAFYIAFYAGIAIEKYLWSNYTIRDRDAELLLNWLKNQNYYKRRNGSDHFIMLGRLTCDFRRFYDNDETWGSRFLYMPLMKNVLRLSVEKSALDPIEISVPYPTSFHPRFESDVFEWQKFVSEQKRSSLFCFVGAERKNLKNDFRGLLLNYCKQESESKSKSKSKSCKVVDCSLTSCYHGAPAILEAFLDSDFCLQPRGEGMTRRSFFDCMLAGSIPVYFWKESFENQYIWHINLGKKKMISSVFIDHEDVRNDTSLIKKVLEGYTKEEVKKMRETVIQMIPRFVYAMPNEGLNNRKDAFDISIEGVLKKFHLHQKKKKKP